MKFCTVVALLACLVAGLVSCAGGKALGGETVASPAVEAMATLEPELTVAPENRIEAAGPVEVTTESESVVATDTTTDAVRPEVPIAPEVDAGGDVSVEIATEIRALKADLTANRTALGQMAGTIGDIAGGLHSAVTQYGLSEEQGKLEVARLASQNADWRARDGTHMKIHVAMFGAVLLAAVFDGPKGQSTLKIVTAAVGLGLIALPALAAIV